MSGESVVCRKTLTHSQFDYDVCCGPMEARGDGHIRLFPAGGNKYLKWPFETLRQFRALDRAEDYAVMMSRVMPPNGHLAGWLIKRAKPCIKWVAYFSDPIWNSPFLKFSFRKDESHRPNGLLMKVFGFPAKWAVREADLLVFNNLRLAKYILGSHYEKYKDKVLIVPYGHEGIEPRHAPERGDGKFRLTHVGQIYGNRTMEALVAGAELLKEREPEQFERLAIRQVGFVCKAEKRRVELSRAASAFTIVGQVPYEESIEEMYAADCLLVIDPVFDDPRQNIYVPGKIYDYMSTGRPIFCVSDLNSATGDIATGLNFRLSPPAFELLYAALKDLAFDSDTSKFTNDLGQYHCQIGVHALDAAMAKLFKEQDDERAQRED